MTVILLTLFFSLLLLLFFIVFFLHQQSNKGFGGTEFDSLLPFGEEIPQPSTRKEKKKVESVFVQVSDGGKGSGKPPHGSHFSKNGLAN